ncbi:HMG-box domain-containing protein [Polystyrenella longa]|uniref:hypothetical protein n=1 Tax=Polystyrenella longa TaxID=2528007 RepID=UPI0011A7040F|nr:hypothetical protein [Polystyrenella longa]
MQPWHLLVFALASWVNREQQLAIEYLKTDNSILRDKLGKKWGLLNDDERRRLASKESSLAGSY